MCVAGEPVKFVLGAPLLPGSGLLQEKRAVFLELRFLTLCAPCFLVSESSEP